MQLCAFRKFKNFSRLLLSSVFEAQSPKSKLQDALNHGKISRSDVGKRLKRALERVENEIVIERKHQRNLMPLLFRTESGRVWVRQYVFSHCGSVTG